MAAKAPWTFPLFAALFAILLGELSQPVIAGERDNGGVGKDRVSTLDSARARDRARSESYVIDAAFMNPATGISRLVVSANGQAAFFHQWNQGDTLRDTISKAALQSFERALRSAKFCRLRSVAAEGLFNYTSVSVHFKSSHCVIVLRDTDWARNRRARIVSRALERIKREVCRGDCPGSL